MAENLVIASVVLFFLSSGSLSVATGENPKILLVAADGQAQYATVQAAIDAAPSGAVRRIGPETFCGVAASPGDVQTVNFCDHCEHE